MTQKKSHLKKFVWLFLLVAGGGGSFAYYKMQRSRPASVTYKEVAVTSGNLEITILSTGVVQPQNRLEIKPPIPGRIEEVLVEEGDRVRKGQIVAWMSSTERAALLDSARSKGAEEVKRWEDLYRPTPIIAPISGMIILKNVEPGQSFNNTDAVLVISDRLTVKAQVDETDISRVKSNQKASIVLDAYAEQAIEAKVDKIAYDAKTVNNVTTYIVDVVPLQTPEFMRSGMTANVTFYIASREGVMLIPSEALKVQNDKYQVLLKNQQPEAPPLEREIQVGMSDGKRTEVVNGLRENDVILIPEAKLPEGGDKPKSPFSPFGGGSRRRG